MRPLFVAVGQGPELHTARWGEAALYASIVTAAAVWPVWPGVMSYDSFIAYEQSFTGIQSLNWPPTHTYLFWLSRSLGAGAWGVFLSQTFLLFFAAAATINQLVASRLRALGAQAAFALLFVAVPPLLGTLSAQWRDVTTASFALLAIALWLAGARRRSITVVVGAAAALGAAVSLRYNAAPLFVLVVPLMILRPFLGGAASGKARLATALALALFISLALASTKWRLPDLKRPDPVDPFAAVQLWDLVGISAWSGENHLPPAVTQGAPISISQIRQAYDHLNVLSVSADNGPGVPRLFTRDDFGQVKPAWARAVREAPGAYLAHRWAVMTEMLGLVKDEVYYPTHGVIDPNRFGIAFARPAAAQAVADYVSRSARALWRRQVWLYLLAALAVVAAARAQRGTAVLLGALLGGAYAYVGLLFFAAPAADARYLFPSSVTCGLILCVGLALGLIKRRT